MKNSITERAMLVSLTINQWFGNKHDKKISDEVARNHNSDSSMGRYQKLLIAKESLERIRQITSAARNEHYMRTLPWNDGGVRILSSQGYFEYAEKMRAYQRDYESAVSDFIAQYPQLVAAARQRLNGLFNEADYPSLTRLTRKFAFGFNIQPMPTAQDFRVELGDAETARVRSEIETSVNESLRTAMDDVWARVHDVVSKMVDRLNAYEVDEKTGKVNNVFRDTLVTNIRDLIAMLPTLNITEDQKLTQFAKRIDAELCSHTPEQLRESVTIREKTASAAAAILKEMGEYI